MKNNGDARLKVTELLESALYVTDLAAAETFYTEILGLALDSKMQGRHVFLRCGNRMVLLFNAEATVQAGDGPGDVPGHGAQGAGHFAFAARDCEMDPWKEQLVAHGVDIEKEIYWGGSRSLYFRDPSGNCIEIASPVIWGIEEDAFFQNG